MNWLAVINILVLFMHLFSGSQFKYKSFNDGILISEMFVYILFALH